VSAAGCPNATVWRSSCKRRTCPECGIRWVKNWRTVLRVNFEALGRPVVVVAITAPGKDRLPWDTNQCTHGPRAKCSGPRHGCRVQDRAVREWGDTLSWRWAKLRNNARMRCQRAGLSPLLVDRVYEPQKRGAPHLHVVLAYGTLPERRAAQMFADELARLAPSYDFGFVQTQLRSMTGAEAAAYLTSYFVGGSKKKPSIRDTVKNDVLPRSLIWLTPTLTRETLVTMRMLRRTRHLWAAARGFCPWPRWRDVDECFRVRNVYASLYGNRAPPPPMPSVGPVFAAAAA
jgi:hypothetical protein